MPQFDVSSFPPQFVWLAITFILLYGLMAWLGLPRVGAVLEQRRQRIGGDLEKAEQMKAEAQAVIAAYERALAEARGKAQETLRQTMDRLNAAAAERQRQATVAIAAQTAAAERRIAEARSAALAHLRDVAVETARAAAGRLAGLEIDASHAGAAVDGILREQS